MDEKKRRTEAQGREGKVAYRRPSGLHRLFPLDLPPALTDQDKDDVAKGFAVDADRATEIIRSHNEILRDYLNLLPPEYGRPSKEMQNAILDRMERGCAHLIGEIDRMPSELVGTLELRLRPPFRPMGGGERPLDTILAGLRELGGAAARAHSRNAGNPLNGPCVAPGKPNSKRYTVAPPFAKVIAHGGREDEAILAPVEYLVDVLSREWSRLTGTQLSKSDKPFDKSREAFTATQYVSYIVSRVHPGFAEKDARNAIAAWQAERRRRPSRPEDETESDGDGGPE